MTDKIKEVVLMRNEESKIMHYMTDNKLAQVSSLCLAFHCMIK